MEMCVYILLYLIFLLHHSCFCCPSPLSPSPSSYRVSCAKGGRYARFLLEPILKARWRVRTSFTEWTREREKFCLCDTCSDTLDCIFGLTTADGRGGFLIFFCTFPVSRGQILVCCVGGQDSQKYIFFSSISAYYYIKYSPYELQWKKSLIWRVLLCTVSLSEERQKQTNVLCVVTRTTMTPYIYYPD